MFSSRDYFSSRINNETCSVKNKLVLASYKIRVNNNRVSFSGPVSR
ncbi:hypothetical protein OMAG_001452 [Candidatus Omnitrophus magneticus]|uniref:Uncharacterized protein n=1 Tax=Candidatus Omnitrophus magneticus TaxID=1609969 RepID=A0A0F0CTD3_9BACT|nr:hypothetical protein OMAG_002464 [Candidatus Omnitrophus magneticus]KJJ84680.1 hypothetical protein OMAG_001452 [Candidatus Omnitrophus magneticus]